MHGDYEYMTLGQLYDEIESLCETNDATALYAVFCRGGEPQPVVNILPTSGGSVNIKAAIMGKRSLNIYDLYEITEFESVDDEICMGLTVNPSGACDYTASVNSCKYDVENDWFILRSDMSEREFEEWMESSS